MYIQYIYIYIDIDLFIYICTTYYIYIYRQSYSYIYIYIDVQSTMFNTWPLWQDQTLPCQAYDQGYWLQSLPSMWSHGFVHLPWTSPYGLQWLIFHMVSTYGSFFFGQAYSGTGILSFLMDNWTTPSCPWSIEGTNTQQVRVCWVRPSLMSQAWEFTALHGHHNACDLL